MPKKRRKTDSVQTDTTLHFHKGSILLAFSNGLVRDAGVMNIWIRGVEQCVEADDVGAFTEQERAHLEKATSELRMAQRRMLVIGRRGQARVRNARS